MKKEGHPGHPSFQHPMPRRSTNPGVAGDQFMPPRSKQSGQNQKSLVVQNYLSMNPEYFAHSQNLTIQSLQPRGLPKQCREVAPEVTAKYEEMVALEDQLDTALLQKVRDLEGDLYLSQQSDIQYAPLNLFHLHFGLNQYSAKSPAAPRRGVLLELRLDPSAVDTRIQPFYSFFERVEVHFAVERLHDPVDPELGPQLRQRNTLRMPAPSSVIWEFDKDRGCFTIQSGKGEEERKEGVLGCFESPNSFISTKPRPSIFGSASAESQSGVGGISVFSDIRLPVPSNTPQKVVASVASQFLLRAEVLLFPQGGSLFFQIKKEPLAGIVGMRYVTRPQVIAALWEYIKSRKLQDPENLNEVIADKLLTEALELRDPHIAFSTILIRLQRLLRPAGPIRLLHEIHLGGDWRTSEEKLAVKTFPLKNRSALVRQLVLLKREREEKRAADNQNSELLSRLYVILHGRKTGERRLSTILEEENFKAKQLLAELSSKLRAYTFFKNYALSPGPTLKAALLEASTAAEILAGDRYQTQKFASLERRKPTAFFQQNEHWLLRDD